MELAVFAFFSLPHDMDGDMPALRHNEMLNGNIVIC